MARLLVIPLALLLLVAGAFVWSGSGVQQRAEFRFINRGDIFTLDINQMSYLQDFRLTYAIREGLYNLDAETTSPSCRATDMTSAPTAHLDFLPPQAVAAISEPPRLDSLASCSKSRAINYLFYYIKNAEATRAANASDKNPSIFATVGIKISMI
jgi:hypothetical protein